MTYLTVAGNAGLSQLHATESLESLGTVVATPQAGANCTVAATSSRYSYDTDGSCGFVGKGDTSSGSDPILGALADNGGPTSTMLPSTESPLVSAIPKRACRLAGINVDQRGELRPQGAGCEIGAVEVNDRRSKS